MEEDLALPSNTLALFCSWLQSGEGFVAASQAIMAETVTNVSEYQAIAKQKLPKMAYDYYASGAEDEWTLKENREAFSRIL